jgi:hypothetical protein
MRRLTRLLLIVSAAAALALQTFLGARAHAQLPVINLSACLGVWIVARVWPTVARALVLGLAYAFPVAVLVTMHGFDDTMLSVWTAALLGLVLGTTGFSTWALPSRWQWPLALWGLAVAASWPVVVWRELDFTIAQLDRASTSVTHIGISPAAECAWIAHAAATHLLGILWADALWREPSSPRFVLPRSITLPLLVSATGSALVAIYQMFGHIAVLNPTVFAAFHRSAGLMLDGNAFGMSAALWMAGACALAATWPSLRARVALVAAAGCLALGTWASGSQSALLAVGLGGAGVAYGAWRARSATRWRARSLAAAAAIVVLVAVALGLASRHSAAVGPVARLAEAFRADPSRTKASFLSTLWTRDRYGAVSAALIREFPITGVGIGLFNSLVVDESDLHGLGTPTPDNAQNWFRQELAELGIWGSLGWLIWLVVLAPTVWRRPPPGASSMLAAFALRGAIGGLGLASLVGVPTMNPVVLVTFWTFVCWHTKVVVADAPRASPAVSARGRAWPWAVAIGLAVAYAASVHWVSLTSLRVPFRALAVGWPYDHGFFDPEHRAGDGVFRWTEERAVAVIQTPRTDGYLTLTFWVSHPDVATRPVRVQIWRGRTLVIDEELRDSTPVTRYLHVRADQVAVMIETSVDRTWRPSEHGSSDTRALGLGMADWTFNCCPPPGARRID